MKTFSSFRKNSANLLKMLLKIATAFLLFSFAQTATVSSPDCTDLASLDQSNRSWCMKNIGAVNKFKRHFGEDHSSDGPFIVKGTTTTSVLTSEATPVTKNDTSTPLSNSTEISRTSTGSNAQAIALGGFTLIGVILLL